jgi:DNA-binding IclR family transcriptional regulator
MRVPSDKNQVQVIARAAHILRALEGEDSGLSLGQIAARVGLARSTVQRIVASLETEKLRSRRRRTAGCDWGPRSCGSPRR